MFFVSSDIESCVNIHFSRLNFVSMNLSRTEVFKLILKFFLREFIDFVQIRQSNVPTHHVPTLLHLESGSLQSTSPVTIKNIAPRWFSGPILIQCNFHSSWTSRSLLKKFAQSFWQLSIIVFSVFVILDEDY